MKFFSAAALALFVTPAAPAVDSPAPSVVVLNHVTVIDATGAPAQGDCAVVIAGDRIAACGKAGEIAMPEGARVIDGSGKFLIPGLWDMHMHLSLTTDLALPALVANGVTGVRDMGGDLHQIDEWRRAIGSGRRVGPRIFRAGPLVDGPKKDAPFRVTVTDPAEARRAVAELTGQGVDFIKVHNLVPRDAYFALADECRRRRIRYAGHIPRGISAEEATASGQASIEHTETLVEAATFQPGSGARDPQTALASYTETRRKDLFAKFVENGTAFCPTLVEYWGFASEGDPWVRDDPRRAYVARAAREHMDRYFPLAPPGTSPERYALRKAFFRKLRALVGEMQRAGVTLLAGTDPPVWGVYPGFSVHDELDQLVQAGLTPMQALQAATRNPARWLGHDKDLGTMEKGKKADLVLLGADPLQGIANTRKIFAVVAGGRVFLKPELEAMLADLKKAAR